MALGLPDRIQPDAILEAIVDVRFLSSDFPEMVVGRLLSAPEFAEFSKVRLPQADIPPSAREVDPNLRFQPMYQLQNGTELVRFGVDMISFHLVSPYCGWDEFRKRATDVVTTGLAICGGPAIERLGLRYVNGLSGPQHGVAGVADLNLTVSVKDRVLTDVTVSFLSDAIDDTETLVRIASKRHVLGDVPDDISVIVDIDVRTTATPKAQDINSILVWLDAAHTAEKRQFFELLPESIVQALLEA